MGSTVMMRLKLQVEMSISLNGSKKRNANDLPLAA
jgi:hypothetical protein